VLVDRDFTALGGPPKTALDSHTGKSWTQFKTLSDPATTDRVVLSYSSKTGAMKLSLANLDLTGISDGAAHLTVEVTIGAHVYATGVTLFEASENKYSIPIP